MEVVAVYEDPETAETPALDSVSRAFGDHIPSLSVTNIILADVGDRWERLILPFHLRVASGFPM